MKLIIEINVQNLVLSSYLLHQQFSLWQFLIGKTSLVCKKCFLRMFMEILVEITNYWK